MHLTKRAIDELKPRDKSYLAWADGPLRLGVRVSPSGRKYFVLDYTTLDGRRRRLTLGRYGHLTLDDARRDAERKMADVAFGGDPLRDREDAHAEMAFGEFKTAYVKWAREHKKPATLRNDLDALERLIEPEFRNRKLSSITRRDVAQLHQSLSDHPAQANRALAVLSHVFSMACTWGVLPEGSNPCQHVKRFRETKRSRYLTTEELARLGKALGVLETQGEQEEPTQKGQKKPRRKKSYADAVRAVRLLLLTGCRLNEILTLRWDDVDIERRLLHLRDAKAGPRDVPLGAAAVTLLKAAPHKNEWVIPGRLPGTHLVNLSKFWHEQVLPLAGLPGVRLHDLRHTVGATGASAGFSMLIVGTVLGHRQVATTERYSHLAPSPLHAAADRIASEIDAALSGREPAEVVEVKK